MKLYIDKKISVGFSISVLVLVSLGLISFLYVRQVIFSSVYNLHFEQALIKLEQIKFESTRLDVARLQFSITRDSEFVTSHLQSSSFLRNHVRELDGLIAEDTVQQKNAALLKQSIQNKITLSEKLVQTIKESPEGAKAISPDLVFKTQNQYIIDLIKEIGNQEIELKKERQFEVTRQFYRFAYMSSGLLAVSVLLPLILAYLLNKSLMSRTLAEEKLRQALAEIHDLYENAPCGYFSVNKDGMVVNANKTTLEWLGYRKEELMDRLHYSDILKSNDKNNFNRVKEEKEAIDMESSLIKKNKSTFPVIINATVIKDKNDNYLSSRWSLFNNTARKKAEEETMRAHADLEAFSYSVSHDLRAPLRSINGYAQILQDEYGSKLGEEGIQTLNVVIKNAIRMGRLIDDLLNFSKLGKKEIVRSITDMNAMVNTLLEDLLHHEKNRKIELQVNLLENSYVDLNMIQHVWENLLSNALKYTSKKEVAIIEVGSENHPDEIVYFVKDNGAGFDMKYKDKLFSVFQRLHKQNEFDGTGVGLALAKRIIDKHHGRIWVDAEPGKGANFYFSIPK